MEKHIVWNGHDSYQLSDFKDCTKVTVESSSLYYSTLFRFLWHLNRLYSIEIVLDDQQKELAEIIGFNYDI